MGEVKQFRRGGPPPKDDTPKGVLEATMHELGEGKVAAVAIVLLRPDGELAGRISRNVLGDHSFISALGHLSGQLQKRVEMAYPDGDPANIYPDGVPGMTP